MSGRGRGTGGRGGGRGGGRFEGGRGGGRFEGGRGGGRGAGRGDGGRGGRAGAYDAGRGGGGAYRDQTAPMPPSGRGGNVPASVVHPVVQPAAAVPAAYTASSSSSAEVLGNEMEKMTIGSSAGPSGQQAVMSQQPPTQPPSSSRALVLPVRPGYGRGGRRCIVRANHFLVKVTDNDLHHYDVIISLCVHTYVICIYLFNPFYCIFILLSVYYLFYFSNLVSWYKHSD